MRLALPLILLALVCFTACIQRTEILDVFTKLPPPIVSLEAISSIMRGGVEYEISFTAKAPEGGLLREVRFDLSKNGGEFLPITTLSPDQTSFFWTVPQEDVASAQLRLVAINNVGQANQVLSPHFEIRARYSRLLIGNSGEMFTPVRRVAITGNCEKGLPIKVSQVRGRLIAEDLSTSINCESGQFTLEVSADTDDRRDFVFTQVDEVGHVTSTPIRWTSDTEAPELQTFVLHNGESKVSTNHLKTALEAHDNFSGIKKFCLKYNAPETAPALSDKCWVGVDEPNPGQEADEDVDFDNYFFRIGYGKGSYRVTAWVHDKAGNVSNGITRSVTYEPPTPPRVSHVIAHSSEVPSNPMSETDMKAPVGSPLIVKWRVEEPDLANITLLYTTDDFTYTELLTVNNGQNGSCVVNSASTIDDYATGCAVVLVPNASGTDKYFRIRVAARDLIGSVSFGISNPVNLESFKFLAGNTELGLDGSAMSAVFSPMGNQMLAVGLDGRIYFLDNRGILVVSPVDGVQRLLLPRGRTGGDGQVVPGALPGCSDCASVFSPRRIALTHKGNLLIYDYDRIRLLDLSVTPMTLTTIIGGGTKSDDVLTNPLDLKIEPDEAAWTPTYFFALPNGDILFPAEKHNSKILHGGGARRYLAAENKVVKLVPRGPGLVFNKPATFDECVLHRVGVTYDPTSSAITNFIGTMRTTSSSQGQLTPTACGYPNHTNAQMFFDYVTFNPSTMAQLGRKPPYLSTYIPATPGAREGFYFNQYQGMDGKLYAMGNGNHGHKGVYRYNSDGNTWDLVLGPPNPSDPTRLKGYSGVCPDGTLATSPQCRVDPVSVFADARGTIYFVDKGQIRVIQEDNTVLTLAGAPRSSLDGPQERPEDARIGEVWRVQYHRRGNVDNFVFADRDAFRFREFTEGGPILTIAGTGDEAVGVNATTAAGVAKTSPLWWGSDGPVPVLSVDAQNGNIYALRIQSRQPYVLVRNNPATDAWAPFGNVPGGVMSYGPLVMGYHDGKLLLSTYKFCHDPKKYGACGGKYLEFYGDASGVPPFTNVPYTKVMGTPDETDLNISYFCSEPSLPDQEPVGNDPLNCFGAGGSLHAGPTAAQPLADSAENPGWLVKKARYTKRIIHLVPGHRVWDFATLNQDAFGGFAYVPASGLQPKVLYYCSRTGDIFRRDMSTNAERSVPKPVSRMKCNPEGGTMIHSSSRNSIIFDYLHNGLSGIGELKPRLWTPGQTTPTL